MKNQIRKQRLQTIGIDGWQGASRDVDPQISEHADPHGVTDFVVYDLWAKQKGPDGSGPFCLVSA